MIDLGDTVPLALRVTDSSGTLADVGAGPVLTITQPDGSTSTPAVTHGGTGLYSATFVPTQAGRHGVRWVGTGANACAYTDVFNVTAAVPGMVISLADARAAVGLPAAAIAKDELLRGYVAAATPLLEDLVGPILPRVLTETYDGGGRTVRLLQAPVLSVQSVSESYGNFVRTLTAQPLDGSTFDAYGYTIDLVDGILTRRVSGQTGLFTPGRRNVLVSYTAGRTVVGENLLRAAQRLVRWLWEPEQGMTRPDVSSGDTTVMAVTPSGYTIPRDVITLAGTSDVKIVGIG